VRDHNPYVDHWGREDQPLAHAGLIVAVLIAMTLLFVWSAGEVAGAIGHGTWPGVSLAQSAAELVQLCQHPGDPLAPGIPGGGAYFGVLAGLILVAGGGAIALLRLVRPRRRHWVPPLPLSSSSHEPFLRVYRRGRMGRSR
jgi:hypothetical protein